VPDGDDYLISGEKSFISLAPVASLAIVFAKDETERVSAFIVDTSSPGFAVGEPHDIMGSRGLETSPIYLDNVRIPKENLLGEKRRGYQILLEGAGRERLSVAIGCLGMGQRALDLSIDYAKQRIAYGSPIAQMPTIQWHLAEMASRIEASRWLVYRTAFLRDQGENIQKESAIAKLFCSQMVVDVTRMAMQIHGAYGTERKLPIERLYRDAKMTEIIVGVSEIQRVLIAAYLLQGR
jgi:butyryl-CoA dehydrogenase